MDFGVNGTSSILQAPNSAARLALLDDVAALGARYVRIDVTWSFIEPTPGSYSWTYYDAVMTDIRAARLTPLLLLAYGNEGYGSPTNYDPPTDYADYATWAATVAARYAGGPWDVRLFQVWNEPNLNHFWNNAPDADEYTELLALASTAIRAEVPTAKILSAGIAPSGMTAFVTDLYTAGADVHFDALAIHPYIGEGADSVEDVRGVMVSNGDSSKQMWATEFGWSSWDTPGNSEALQASRFSGFIPYWRTVDGAGPLLAYTHKDTGVGAEGEFGLLRSDDSRKPAWTAFRDAIPEPEDTTVNPTTDLIDDFERGDSATLGSSYTVDPFAEGAASPRITGGQVANHASTSYNLVAYNVEIFTDSEAWIEVPVIFNSGAYRALYLIVRAGGGAGYMIEWTISGDVTLYEYPGGASIATTSGVVMAPGALALLTAQGG